MRPSGLRLIGVMAALLWASALFAPVTRLRLPEHFIMGTAPGYMMAALGWLLIIRLSVAWYANIPFLVGLFRLLAGRRPGLVPSAVGGFLAATAVIPFSDFPFPKAYGWMVDTGSAVYLWLGAFAVVAACEVLYGGPASPKPCSASPTPLPPERKIDCPITSASGDRDAHKRPWFGPSGIRLLSFITLAGSIVLSVTTGMQARVRPLQGSSVDGTHDLIYDRANVLSPDGNHVAVTQRGQDTWYMDSGDVFEVWVGKADAPRASFTLAFSSHSNADVAWIDDRHLVVTLGDWKGKPLFLLPKVPQLPTVMLRNVAGVTISYRLADGLLEPAFQRALEQWEQQAREKREAGRWNSITSSWGMHRLLQQSVSNDMGNALGDTVTTDGPNYDLERSFPSQDGSMIAVLKPSHWNETPDELALYEVRVGQRDDPRSKFATVFSTLDGLPDIEWTGAKTLTITLNYLSRVRTSLHQAGDIAIVYRIADRMREAEFRQRLDRWRQDAEETDPTQKSILKPTRENNLAETERRLAAQWDEYEHFQEWVRANIHGSGG